MEALAPFRVGGCLLSSEPAPPLRNLRWCQVPVAIVSTDLHDWRAWTGRAQVTGAPQLHLEEPQPPRILLLKQQSGWEWSGCWGGVCVSGGGGSYGDPLQQPWCKPGSSWSPEEGSPPPSQVRKQRLREAGCRDAAGISVCTSPFCQGPVVALVLHEALASSPGRPCEGDPRLHGSPAAQGGRAPPCSGGFSDSTCPSRGCRDQTWSCHEGAVAQLQGHLSPPQLPRPRAWQFCLLL